MLARSTALARQPAYATTLPYRGREDLLSPAACAFLCRLHAAFADRVEDLMRDRAARQARLDAGELPDFLAETRRIREADWRVGPVPADLRNRRVEITGPVDRKLIINAMNSGADVFMADFEDAHCPTWEGTLDGQDALYEAVRRELRFLSPAGRLYRLNPRTATLVVRPRGWHLPEKHFLVYHQPIPAALFDFGLFLFHNGQYLLTHDSGPYFYLPKLEGHLEARLWRQVFRFAEQDLGLPRASIKATVLIETLPAAFEMHEILYELREHVTGLNCGRWDYIFSFIKKLHRHPRFVLPERGQVTMASHFLRSYSRLLIQTCHRRGAYALGGMAAQIPVKDDPEANARAFAQVRADKEREAGDGHDGTWVAHPDLVPVAREVFDRHMPGPNQLQRTPEALDITASDLLRVPAGSITEAGLRANVAAALHYLAAWLGGRGAVPLHHLMEDAATAEIARAQLWQWIHHPGGVLADGRRVTRALFRQCLAEALADLRDTDDAGRHYPTAAELLRDVVEYDRFTEFLTLPAYERLP